MDDSFLMRRVQAVRYLNGQIQQFLCFKRSARDSMLESLSLQKLHDNEGLALMLADFVDGTNVGMIQSGSGSRLALKPLQGHSIGG